MNDRENIVREVCRIVGEHCRDMGHIGNNATCDFCGAVKDTQVALTRADAALASTGGGHA